MTKPRDYSGSTKFSNWLRQQKELDSKDGYVTTDADYIWSNYKTGKFMIIEEKCQMQDVTFTQRNILKVIHKCCRTNENYLGMHRIKFQFEYPEDGGKIYLNDIEITKKELIQFLRFEKTYKQLKNYRKSLAVEK